MNYINGKNEGSGQELHQSHLEICRLGITSPWSQYRMIRSEHTEQSDAVHHQRAWGLKTITIWSVSTFRATMAEATRRVVSRSCLGCVS